MVEGDQGAYLVPYTVRTALKTKAPATQACCRTVSASAEATGRSFVAVEKQVNRPAIADRRFDFNAMQTGV